VCGVRSSSCLLLLPSSVNCVVLPRGIYGGCLIVYLHSRSLGNYSGVSALFVSIVVWFFIKIWYIVNYNGNVITVYSLCQLATVGG
jgi:hypothetical protein